MTYDNVAEIGKIRRWSPHAGLALRIRVPNTGAMVELSSKFGAAPGEAVDLIAAAFDAGLVVEGLSFHVGSQTTNYDNFVQALQSGRRHLPGGAAARLRQAQHPRHRRRLSRPLQRDRPPLRGTGPHAQLRVQAALSPRIEILAEPGRFLVATAATAVVKIIGAAVRDGKPCYYVDDGVYHTFSGIIFDHCQYHLRAFKKGPTQICSVFGPTCDALDTISLAEDLPELDLGDFLYSENIGAYSHASSTSFNGFPPAKVLHINRD